MRRRTVLGSIGTSLGVAIAGCLSTPGRSANETEEPPSFEDDIAEGTWPQVGYDAQNTRHIPDVRGPRDDAVIAWTTFGDRPVYPLVVDGDNLYLTDAWTDGTAFALAAQDGNEQWSNADLPTSRWAPALHEGRLIVVTRTKENRVRLHALDTATGEQEWVREEGFTASSQVRPPISPTVRDGAVYIGSNRGILACEAATGAIEWTATLGEHVVETDDGHTWRTDWTKPAVTANRAITFDVNESYRATREVYAVDRASGEQDWTAELDVGDGWYLKGHAVVGANHVFVSALDPHVSTGLDDSEWSGSERLFALDRQTGAIAWDWELPRKTLSTPAYANGTLYVGEWYPDEDTGRLHAIDVTDWSKEWTYKTEVGAVLSPTVAGDTVYFNQGEELAAVATEDGVQRWRLEIGARTGAPVVVGNAAYLRTNPGHNYDSQLLAVREG